MNNFTKFALFTVICIIVIVVLIGFIVSYDNQIQDIEKDRDDFTVFWNDPKLKLPGKSIDESIKILNDLRLGIINRDIKIEDIPDNQKQYYDIYVSKFNERTNEDMYIVNLHRTKWNLIYAAIGIGIITVIINPLIYYNSDKILNKLKK